MGLGRLLALGFRAGTLVVFIRWPLAAPSAAPDFFLRNSPAALAAGRATGSIADSWPQPRQADGSRTCARSRDFEPCTLVVFIRWQRWRRRAPRRISFCAIHRRAGRWPSYGVDGDSWPQPRQADGSRTSARSRDFEPAHWWSLSVGCVGGAERRAGFFLRNSPAALAAGRATGSIGDSWPQPRQADGSRTCARSSIPGRHIGGLYPLAALAAPSAAPDFFLHNSPAALAAGRATGSMATAGRSRGKLMGLGRVLARDSGPAHWWSLSVGALAAPSAAPDFFLLNSPAALAAGRATGSMATAGRSRGKLMVSRTCARSRIPGRHIGGLYPLAACGGAERRAGFLFAQFTGGAGRWPSYGVDRRPLAAAAAS